MVNTGTHGGDVNRPPISDFVDGMLVVGSGGRVRLLLKDSSTLTDSAGFARVVETANGLGAGEVDVRVDQGLFESALIGLGAFGVVYAYIVELEPRAGLQTFQYRRAVPWSQLKTELNRMIADAKRDDRYLGFVTTPIAARGEDRRCVVIHAATVAETTSDFAALFSTVGQGLEGARPRDVGATRNEDASFSDLLDAFSADDPTHPAVLRLRLVLGALVEGLIGYTGLLLTVALPPAGVIVAVVAGATILSLAAALNDLNVALGRLSRHYRLGDAVVEALGRRSDPIGLAFADAAMNALLYLGQPTWQHDNPLEPWLVRGHREHVYDFHNYTRDRMYRGVSIEIFFPANTALAGRIEQIYAICDELHWAGTPIAAYLAVRFFAPSRATLATTPAPPGSTVCSVEVAMLRGMHGNQAALDRLRDLAIHSGGRVHWGQRHDLDRQALVTTHGADALDRWARDRATLEGDSPTFVTDFVRRRGLVHRLGAGGIDPAGLDNWQPIGARSDTAPVSAIGKGGYTAVVCAADSQVTVVRRRGGRTLTRQAIPGPIDSGARPAALFRPDGRLEIVTRSGGSGPIARPGHLAGTWEREPWHPGDPPSQFTAWDIKEAGRDPVINRVGIAAIMRTDDDVEVVARDDTGEPALVRVGSLHGAWGDTVPAVQPDFSSLLSGQRVTTGPLRGPLTFTGRPEAADAPERMLVIGVLNGRAAVCRLRDPAATRWTELPEPPSGVGAIACVSTVPYRTATRIAAITEHGALIVIDDDTPDARDPSFRSWHHLPDIPALKPGAGLAMVDADGVTWLAGRAMLDNSVIAVSLATGRLPRVTRLGGQAGGPLAMSVDADGFVEIYTRNPDADVYVRRQIAPGAWEIRPPAIQQPARSRPQA
ncbi:hypothetical protein [Nostocoides sp. F2B08]|uniref:hypothetical protein n=1 Tax=Nostocoides sp. F2B08 TaxID=2653936 RepID=UPI001D04E744|nr:hypothetical protein [Tetrasphaera sp. F2B08]